MVQKIVICLLVIVTVSASLAAFTMHNQYIALAPVATLYSSAKKAAEKECLSDTNKNDECSHLVVTDISELSTEGTPDYAYFNFELRDQPNYGSISVGMSLDGEVDGIQHIPVPVRLR